MLTQPNILCNVNDMRQIGSAFMKNLKIDDCDKPFPAQIEITKVESNSICVSYDIKKEYYMAINKPIKRVCIEYALIKNDKVVWADYKKEKENGSQYDVTDSSDSDSSNLSDSNSDSHSILWLTELDDAHDSTDRDFEGNENGTNVRSKKKLMKSKKRSKKKRKNKKMKVAVPMIQKIHTSAISEYDELKSYMSDIILKKASKKDKKYEKKYKIEEKIKSEKTYIVRMKLLNECGWSEYCNQLYVAKTPKVIIQSKILTNKEKVKLKKLVDKQTKYKFNKWKLLFRGSRDGFETMNFFKKCHGKKNTVCIINPQLTNNVFGGKYLYLCVLPVHF